MWVRLSGNECEPDFLRSAVSRQKLVMKVIEGTDQKKAPIYTALRFPRQFLGLARNPHCDQGTCKCRLNFISSLSYTKGFYSFFLSCNILVCVFCNSIWRLIFYLHRNCRLVNIFTNLANFDKIYTI